MRQLLVPLLLALLNCPTLVSAQRTSDPAISLPAASREGPFERVPMDFNGPALAEARTPEQRTAPKPLAIKADLRDLGKGDRVAWYVLAVFSVLVLIRLLLPPRAAIPHADD